MILTFIQIKFPNNTVAIRSAVSGFCFLRFICPALASPDSEVYKIIDPAEGISLANYDLVKDPKLKAFKLPKTLDSVERRRLLLVTKVIQNLANGVIFGAKEKFMLPLNSLLLAAIPKRNLFLDALAGNIRDIFVEQDYNSYQVTDEMVDNILNDDDDDDDDDEDENNNKETDEEILAAQLASQASKINLSKASLEQLRY